MSWNGFVITYIPKGPNFFLASRILSKIQVPLQTKPAWDKTHHLPIWLRLVMKGYFNYPLSLHPTFKWMVKSYISLPSKYF